MCWCTAWRLRAGIIHERAAEHQSVLKPIGEPYRGKTIDLNREVVTDVLIEPATKAEVEDTVAVMGGEDLEMWVEALLSEDLLAAESTVVTYTYIGHELTWPIYRDGTIGKAKEDLEARINALDAKTVVHVGWACVSLGQQSRDYASVIGRFRLFHFI